MDNIELDPKEYLEKQLAQELKTGLKQFREAINYKEVDDMSKRELKKTVSNLRQILISVVEAPIETTYELEGPTLNLATKGLDLLLKKYMFWNNTLYDEYNINETGE